MPEFWPHERWAKPPSLIPRPTRLRRIVCWLTGGHRWAIHYWTGQGGEGWPQHEYCEKCWRFRDREG